MDYTSWSAAAGKNGWISPEGKYMPITGAHITPFKDGTLPLPPEILAYRGKMEDTLQWVTLIVKYSDWVRVAKGRFMAGNPTYRTRKNIEDLILNHMEDYKEDSFISIEYTNIPPLSPYNISFSFREFADNDFHIPVRQVMQMAEQAVLVEGVTHQVMRNLFAKGYELGVMSAYTEFGGATVRDNFNRHAHLLGQLQKIGYTLQSGKGVWGDAPTEWEKSVLIYDIPAPMMRLFHAAYGQVSVLHKAKEAGHPWLYNAGKEEKYPGYQLGIGVEIPFEKPERTKFRRDPSQQFRVEIDYEFPQAWVWDQELREIWNRTQESAKWVLEVRDILSLVA